MYHYFVAYVHTSGSGCTEIIMPYAITDFDHIVEIKRVIEGLGRAREVVITNYQLLRIGD